MHQALAPLKSEFIQQDRQYLEVIVLLVTYHVDHFVDGIIGKTQLSRTDVLSHVYRSSIAAKQQFVIQSFGCQVSPDRTVFLLEEETFLKAFHHFLFAFQVCIGFIIDFIETDSHLTVRFIKTGVYPVIHHLPKRTHFRITGFPFHQHLTRFIHQRGGSFRLFLRHAFLHQLCYFSFVMLIESDIIITYQMIAFFA